MLSRRSTAFPVPPAASRLAFPISLSRIDHDHSSHSADRRPEPGPGRLDRRFRPRAGNHPRRHRRHLPADGIRQGRQAHRLRHRAGGSPGRRHGQEGRMDRHRLQGPDSRPAGRPRRHRRVRHLHHARAQPRGRLHRPVLRRRPGRADQEGRPDQDAQGHGWPQGLGAGRHQVGQLPEGTLPVGAARRSGKEPGNVQPGADRPRRGRRDGQARRQAVRAKHAGPDRADRAGHHRGIRHRRAQEQARADPRPERRAGQAQG